MYISKPLDYFKTKEYNKHKGVNIMRDFMNYNFNIENIVIACFVAPGEGVATHSNRPSHGLALNMGGDKIYSFSDGKKLISKKNDIIYLPKHSYYHVSANTPGACYAINFNISEEVNFNEFTFNCKNIHEFIDLYKRAEHIWRFKKPGFEMKCKAELYNILFNMQNEFNMEYISKNTFEIIRPAVDFIHENYTAEPLTISELSKMCNITPEYFRRIFKNFYGTSPIKYINNLKITRAKELINSGLYSVQGAAELSGYSDLSHFSREFKKATGTPPSQYINTLF